MEEKTPLVGSWKKFLKGLRSGRRRGATDIRDIHGALSRGDWCVPSGPSGASFSIPSQMAAPGTRQHSLRFLSPCSVRVGKSEKEDAELGAGQFINNATEHRITHFPSRAWLSPSLQHPFPLAGPMHSPQPGLLESILPHPAASAWFVECSYIDCYYITEARGTERL
jgi:hypothetical protein